MKSMIPDEPGLRRWLRAFSESADSGVYKKGIDLYRNNRVWDYHASRKKLRASVEDRNFSFFQVTVNLIGRHEPQAGNGGLPDPATGLDMQCSCGRQKMPCEHVAATVVYWILERSGGQTELFATPVPRDERRDREYEKKLAHFRNRSARRVASFAEFDVDFLNMRPDLQKKTVNIATRVMQEAKIRRRP
jgi:hypothetical protein